MNTNFSTGARTATPIPVMGAPQAHTTDDATAAVGSRHNRHGHTANNNVTEAWIV